MKKSIVLLVLCLAVNVRAGEPQKGGAALLNKPVATKKVADADCPANQAVPSNVFSYAKTGKSHIKSLGQIGRTARFEIVSVKVRGLDTPNVAGFLIYDAETDSIIGAQTAGSPGLGVAIVNGAASVGGNFLFGSKIRPDRTEVVAGAIADSNVKVTTENNTSSSAASSSSPAGHKH